MATTTPLQLAAGAAIVATLFGCAAAEPRSRRSRGRRDRLQLARPADPLGELLQVSRPRPGGAGSRTAARSARVRRRRVAGDAGQARDRAGQADRSELVRRIRATNVDERMPPESTHKTLSPQQMAILEQWIENGAEYRPHWAFIAPQRPAVPERHERRRARNEIDRFVLARLEREGLTPSAAADKETLINRVTLTLTGLPPTLAEVDAFVADTAPDAYERLVDRLLASTAYAEHMAGYWLDLARFSETDGFLDDHHDRLLWPYRDWVIDAFARNRPFDEFAHVAARGRLAAERDARADPRDGVLARRQADDRERRDRRRVQSRVHGRAHGQRARHGAPGAHGRLRALPRPQVRSDQADATTTRSARSSTATTSPAPMRRASAAFRAGRRCRGPTTRRLPQLRGRDGRGQREADRLCAPRKPPRPRPRTRGRARVAARGAPRPPASALALADALAAHYAFESARPATAGGPPPPRAAAHSAARALTEFRRNPFSGPPPPPNETAEQRRQREAFELAFARAAQLQRRVADAVAGRDAGRRAGRHPRPAVPRRRTRQRVVLRRDEPRFLGTRRRLLRPLGSVHARFLVLRRRRSTTTSPSSIIWRSRTRAAPATASRSRTADCGRRSRTPRPRT